MRSGGVHNPTPLRGKFGAGIPVTSRGNAGGSEVSVHSSSTSWSCCWGVTEVNIFLPDWQNTILGNNEDQPQLVTWPHIAACVWRCFCRNRDQNSVSKNHTFYCIHRIRKTLLCLRWAFFHFPFFSSYPISLLMSSTIKIANYSR